MSHVEELLGAVERQVEVGSPGTQPDLIQSWDLSTLITDPPGQIAREGAEVDKDPAEPQVWAGTWHPPALLAAGARTEPLTPVGPRSGRRYMATLLFVVGSILILAALLMSVI